MRALIIDNGESTQLAQLLGREIEVGYYSPWAKSFPLSRLVYPGEGIDGVERVNNPLEYINGHKPNLVIVPDIYQTDIELYARDLGIPCFGPGAGARLETDRLFLKELLLSHDLPVGDYEEIDGIDALEKYLRDPANDDKWLKVSVFRGDMNTRHHKNWATSSLWFYDLARRLGPIGRKIKFIAEDPIPDAMEISIEGIIVDGVLLEPFMIGLEIKDAGEFGFYCNDQSTLPSQVQEILAAIGEFWSETEYRNFFAIEMRIIKNGTAYLTDVACRIPTPPGSALASSITNLPSMMLSNAVGGLLAPDVGNTKYLTEIILKSKVVVKDFLLVEIPSEFADSIALFSHCILDDQYWAIPHTPEDEEMETFGSAFYCGQSPEECDEGCRTAAEAVEAEAITFKSNVLDEAQKQMAKAAKLGFKP